MFEFNFPNAIVWLLIFLTEFALVYGTIQAIVSGRVSETRRDARRFNESVLYASRAVNTLSVGFIAGGFILPLINDRTITIWSALWFLVGLILHALGHLILNLLESEDGYDK